MKLAADRTLGGRYLLRERIAVGGMGEVWRAEDTVLGRQVAVKVLKAEYAEDPLFLERFRNEARHTAGLSHPGIASVFDYGEVSAHADDPSGEPGATYLVMELVPGEPLSAILSRRGALPAAETLEILAQTAEALQAAHDAGVVHRDVKPGNVLVRPDGGVKITDFGIARATGAAQKLTQTGMVVGTAYYLSPEQAEGGSVTPASDVYALGVVGYECLAGHRPFSGSSMVAVARAQIHDPPPPLPDTVPRPVAMLVEQALAKDPALRPESAGAFAATARALHAALTGGAVTEPVAEASAPGTRVLTAPVEEQVIRPRWEKNAHPGQQRARMIMLAVGLVVVLLGALLLKACGVTGAPSTPARSSASPSASATPARVRVDAAAYLGHPYPEVKAALESKGLVVVKASTTGGGATGSVKAVSPTGSVPVGSRVTVTVVAAPPPPAPSTHDKHGKGKGDGHG